MAELAIVIPAYRARFFEQALASLAAQTDRDFCVYVGDDASPDDLRSICNNWSTKLNLRYIRFSENLGGRDLVAHWHRCIALSTEPWIWLFSDDDELEPGCVAAWRHARNQHPAADLFHFDVDRIRADGTLHCHQPAYPDVLSARAFALARFLGALSSYAPDYVFRRAALERVGGFEPFPLAWCSDDATWIKISSINPIRKIKTCKVRWRYSGENISSLHNSTSTTKMKACVQYLVWLNGYLASLPKAADDPSDHQIMAASRWWLYAQATYMGMTFGLRGAMRYAAQLSGVREHSFLGTLLRALRSDLRIILKN